MVLSFLLVMLINANFISSALSYSLVRFSLLGQGRLVLKNSARICESSGFVLSDPSLSYRLGLAHVIVSESAEEVELGLTVGQRN